MTIKYYLILGFLALCIISCEDDSVCTAPDWAGTYTGSGECNGDLVDAVIEVTSGSETLVFKITTAAGTETLPAADYVDCSASISIDPLNAEATLSGKSLVLTTTFVDAANGTTECTYNVER